MIYNSLNNEIVELTSEQKKMLEMSEDDIKNGRLISQKAMDKRNLKWLNSTLNLSNSRGLERK